MTQTAQGLTNEQRQVLHSIATTGVTPAGTSERTYMSLVRRLLIGSVDSVMAITAEGCRAIDLDPATALRVGEPMPYWAARA